MPVLCRPSSKVPSERVLGTTPAEKSALWGVSLRVRGGREGGLLAVRAAVAEAVRVSDE